ncbi:MAG: hypothetical protein EOO63_04410 [Hymenobacter sp.]|nr:MAG: hypothetical protein EOO63_04410 [Hymenobacter sp.]
MKQSLRFRRIGCVVLISGLLSCETAGSTDKQQVQLAKPTQADPAVLAAARHYARLLTQVTVAPPDSLLRYAQQVAQPDALPGRYLLRLRAYTVVIEPDSLHPQITIEPAARTQLYSPSPPGHPRRQGDTLHLSLAPRKTNPVLATSLPELVAAFGLWHGDFYAPVEEPLEPDMHTTSLNYRNPATGQSCRVFVHLRDAPQATANAVHDIQLTRTLELP